MAIISHVKLNGIQNRTTSRVVSISQISPMEFHEAQPAPRIVLYVVLGAMIFSVVFTGGIVALFEYDQHQSDSSSWIPIAIQFLIAGTIALVMWFTRLNVWISHEGIRIKMPPFHIGKGRFIPWQDIASVTLRKVSPFGEFGGWGIRWGFGNGMGYVWNGKQGMDLTLNNGKRVVVTLMDIEGARAALKQHGVMLHETI
jgi:hypothetical protein